MIETGFGFLTRLEEDRTLSRDSRRKTSRPFLYVYINISPIRLNPQPRVSEWNMTKFYRFSQRLSHDEKTLGIDQFR